MGDEPDACEVCGKLVGLSSHYHCANCGGVCSVMGHYDPKADDFYCQKKVNDVPETVE